MAIYLDDTLRKLIYCGDFYLHHLEMFHTSIYTMQKIVKEMSKYSTLFAYMYSANNGLLKRVSYTCTKFEPNWLINLNSQKQTY